MSGAQQINNGSNTFSQTNFGKVLWVWHEATNIFIDFKQAFDTANRLKMYENLKMLKIPTKLIRLMKTTLTNSRAIV